MDYEYLSRLRKSLEDLYETKYSMFLNAKEFGEIREHQGYIKAIKKFGELIEENIERNK